jgi:transposase-like protein
MLQGMRVSFVNKKDNINIVVYLLSQGVDLYHAIDIVGWDAEYYNNLLKTDLKFKLSVFVQLLRRDYTLKRVCADTGMTMSTFYDWVKEDDDVRYHIINEQDKLIQKFRDGEYEPKYYKDYTKNKKADEEAAALKSEAALT